MLLPFISLPIGEDSCCCILKLIATIVIEFSVYIIPLIYASHYFSKERFGVTQVFSLRKWIYVTEVAVQMHLFVRKLRFEPTYVIACWLLAPALAATHMRQDPPNVCSRGPLDVNTAANSPRCSRCMTLAVYTGLIYFLFLRIHRILSCTSVSFETDRAQKDQITTNS